MTDTQRIELLKELMIDLIDALDGSRTRDDEEGHTHELFDDADKHSLNRIRDRVVSI